MLRRKGGKPQRPRSARWRVPPRLNRGQSLVEFAVASLVITPLFLLVPLIGKYIDMKHATIASSRTLAFECTVRYEDCANLAAHPSFANEIRTRFFSGNRREVLSNDVPAADDLTAAVSNPLWVDRQGRPLLERYSDIGIRADQRNLNLGGSAVSTLSSVAGPGRFGLQLERGIYEARVQIAVSPTNGGTSFLTQLDSLTLNMQQRTAVLTDAWGARGPGARSHQCNDRRGTVIGRSSRPSICNEDPVTAAAAAAYMPARLLVMGLAAPESNSSRFDFHEFMTEGFAERVPVSDSVGFPRLQ
jgi:hypothetical protein